MQSDTFVGLTVNIGFLSHAIAAVAFVMLTVLLVAGRQKGNVGGWLLAASVITTVWAVLAAYGEIAENPIPELAWTAEVLRSGAWVGFLLTTLMQTWTTGYYKVARVMLPPLLALLCFATIANDIWFNGIEELFDDQSRFSLSMFGRLALAVAGLLLVENMVRNMLPYHRWAVKFFCIGISGIFAYDFFMYSDALLFHEVNSNLLDARGLTTAVVVPLLVVSIARNPIWSLDIFVSRQVIFHTATLIGAGVYLLVMAGVGYYLRQFGGQWGPVLQAMFLFGAVILMLLVVFSGSFRAWLRVNISKHFFSYKYDYREEWLRLINTISSLGTDAGASLPDRVVQGITDLVESPEGALWLRQGDSHFVLHTSWNTAADEGSQIANPGFVRFLEERQWVINLQDLESDPESYEDLIVPDWLSELERAWLIVPLMHHERLLAVVHVGQPRAPKDLNWEDYDLLKTAGRQAASYLAEQESARALVEAQQFDEFNRRFAFVIHDVKNLVSQLSLMLNNAEKHKANPQFQEDMLETVKESVDKMRKLLVRLHESGKEAAATKSVPLEPFLERAVEMNARKSANLTFECSASGLAIVIDEERFSAVIAHLLDNALDATGDDGVVKVSLSAIGREAVIEVEDDGPGMTPEFVRDELFQPFKTTKGGGYGIGAFESREFVRELGGRLDVISKVDVGTRVRISLPAISAEDDGRTENEMVASA